MKKIKLLLITTAIIILAVVCFASCDMFSSSSECDHNWQITSSRDSTCNETGYTEYLCLECGDDKRVEIPMTAHYMVEDEGVPATCYQSGYTSYSFCKICGYYSVEQQYIPALQHRNSHIENKVDPTCEKNEIGRAHV